MNIEPRRAAPIALVLLLALVGTAITTAMTRTSPTFDEIVLIAGGARGYETGRFDLAPDHPPLMQYIYGLPVFLSGPAFPDESEVSAEAKSHPGYRYNYAQHFFWAAGNDPERVSFLGRLPAVFFALGLMILLYSTIGRVYGPLAGLLAAGTVGFLPDVLAHGGVAYNDLPLAFMFFAALWALDAAIRHPTPRRAALAGLLAGLTVAVKISGLALVPAAGMLLVAESVGRRREGGWRRAVAIAGPLTVLVAYLVLVAIYAGDVTLSGIRYAVSFRAEHLSHGHGAGAFLLGETSTTGWWYFFPVAFLYKTSAGLHILMAVALVAFVPALLRAPRRLLTTRMRPLLAGCIVFAIALLTSNLNIGFRYALPVLPLICALTAVGVARAWSTMPRLGRAAAVAAMAWLPAFPLTYYPHFLGFISEYGPDRDRNYTVLVDSSLDWGQGLLELRDFMDRYHTGPVYLSYFGSGVPAGYGIDYVPLPSYFPLPGLGQQNAEAPRFAVISATNLAGVYLDGDPFARFRESEPVAVLANSLLVFPLSGE